MRRLSPAPIRKKRFAPHLPSPRLRVTLFLAVVITAVGPLFLSSYAYAATPLLDKPTSLSGTSGNQQVTLSWNAVSRVTGYQVQLTDLVTGRTVLLSNVVEATTVTLTGLAVGHWYRFSIIPLAGTIQGSASDPIEIRTTGFSGHYDNYYALGDSYASGDGAQPYSGVAHCNQSTKGYPYLLAAGAPAPHLFACQGARTANIDTTVEFSNLPGTQLAQLQSSPRGNTLITVTVGGNDIGFSSQLENCIIGLSSCTSRRTAISQAINALEPRLVKVYQELRAAAPGADIIATGYPLLVADPATARCHNAILYVGLSKIELQMIRDLSAQLDRIITQAATQANITPATQQVEDVFAGHEACASHKSQEWINEIAGLNDSLQDSFHPNAAGFQAFASAINSVRTLLYQSGLVRD